MQQLLKIFYKKLNLNNSSAEQQTAAVDGHGWMPGVKAGAGEVPAVRLQGELLPYAVPR